VSKNDIIGENSTLWACAIQNVISDHLDAIDYFKVLEHHPRWPLRVPICNLSVPSSDKAILSPESLVGSHRTLKNHQVFSSNSSTKLDLNITKKKKLFTQHNGSDFLFPILKNLKCKFFFLDHETYIYIIKPKSCANFQIDLPQQRRNISDISPISSSHSIQQQPHTSLKMAGQQNADLTNLLRWSIENTSTSTSTTSDSTTPQPTQPTQPTTSLDQEALRRLVLGGPSDADRMKDAMAAILHPEVSLDDKVVAFDNFEQLVEGIDNANNMEPLGLWEPLVGVLGSEEGVLRSWAAWCLATAVSNNVKAQEKVCRTIEPLYE
jgi:hypothetical protein